MKEIPDRLYHYTTVSGCLGIIESQSIWLTDHRFLNDKHELQQGLKSFLEHIPEESRTAIKEALSYHEMWNHTCVFSLSRSPTILSQWRAYADDGTGIALGFSSSILDFMKLAVVDCQYDDHQEYAAKLVQKHQQFIETVRGAYHRLFTQGRFVKWVNERHEIFYPIIHDLIALKNPAFSEEGELRAIWSRPAGHKDIRMRSARNLVIPYVQARVIPDYEDRDALYVAIPELWLGPKCSDLNRSSLLSMRLGMISIRRHDCGYV